MKCLLTVRNKLIRKKTGASCHSSRKEGVARNRSPQTSKEKKHLVASVTELALDERERKADRNWGDMPVLKNYATPRSSEPKCKKAFGPQKKGVRQER